MIRVQIEGIGSWPRRSHRGHWHPAEIAIQEAVDAVELVGADVRLTEIVTSLGDISTSERSGVNWGFDSPTNGTWILGNSSTPGHALSTFIAVARSLTVSLSTPSF